MMTIARARRLKTEAYTIVRISLPEHRGLLSRMEGIVARTVKASEVILGACASAGEGWPLMRIV